MNADDLERALRSLTRRAPFRSFQIELNSGDRLLISHPEAVERYGGLFAGPSVCQLIDPVPATPAG
jgi:hypothetical protein